MRGLALLLLLPLLLPVGAGAVRHPRHPQTDVVFLYYGDDFYLPVVESLAAELNTVTADMPGAPRFSVEDQPLTTCEDMPQARGGRIQICTTTNLDPYMADTWWEKRKAVIRIADEPRVREAARLIVCHEMMHAVAHVIDGPKTEDSCVHGYLDHFGSWDLAALAARFAR